MTTFGLGRHSGILELLFKRISKPKKYLYHCFSSLSISCGGPQQLIVQIVMP